MITETGKSIITKYLLGQAPAYASYLAVGSGAIPLTTLSFSVSYKALTTNVATITTSANHNFFVGDYITVSDVDTTFDGIYLITAKTANTISYAKTATNVTSVAVSPVGTVSHNFTNKENLDFEMFRIPVTSRGYVEEDGVSKIVLTGELPTDERYEISEVGLYSAGSNAATSGTNSRTIYAFTTTENWEFHNSVGSSVLPSITEALDFSNANNDINVKTATITSATITGTSVTYIANNLFKVGDLVTVTGVATSTQYNLSSITITEVSNTQFTATIPSFSVNNKALTSNVATITTSANHNFLVGGSITVSGVDTTFDGIYVITGVTANTISYAKTATNVISVAVSPVGTVSFTQTYVSGGTATLLSPPLMFQTSATNTVFLNETRLNRHERLRFLNNVILVDGASSDLSYEFKISTVSGSSTAVTYTTTLPHNLSVGDVVSVYGVVPTAYNLQNVTIATAPTATTFTVTNAATEAYTSGGFVKRTKIEIQSNSTHAHISGVNVNFGENSSTDELRFAFSVLNTAGATSTYPDEVNLILEFASTDHSPGSHATNYAQMDIKLSSDTTSENYYNFDNRYVVKAVELQDIAKANDFTWSVAEVASVYACAFDTYTISNKQLTSNVATITTSSAHGFAVGNSVAVKLDTPDATFDGMQTITAVTSTSPYTFSYAKTAANVSSTAATGNAKSATSNYYIALDAIRLENKSSANPLYGLTGYSVIQNTDDTAAYARPAIKDANTTSFLEFRFTLDVT